ncbi:MAG TPA: peptidase C45 [Planctomycetes bacterium]|nr:peptidase C45 [Fuerstiella sp.]HIK94080.1 peptidase C45 [Planctomycetota bacterium]
MTSTRYPELTVSGSPRQLGQQIGESAREQIRGFCQIALERVNKTMCVSKDRAALIAAESTRYVADWCPDLLEEIRGTAEAAGVLEADLMLLQIRNQLTGDEDAGCTSLSLSGDESRAPIVAQNWDNDPILDEFTVVLTRRPADKPATMMCTQAGLISYMGFSETCIGACVNSLPAPSRNVGVPHYFILRQMYDATSLDEATAVLASAHRAIPVNIMMTTPQGPANLEATVDRIRTLTPVNSHCVTHTNHCVHPDFKYINGDFAELIQSYPRKKRIDELLLAHDSPDLQQVKQALRDHSGHPTSICRHENSDPQHGFWTTVFSIVIQPTLRQMQITRGTPCDNPYETYTMN